MLLLMFLYKTSQLRVVEAKSNEIEKIVDSVVYSPCRTYAIVVQLAALIGGVPALKDITELRHRCRIVVPQPFQLDHGASSRYGHLLVLRREVVLPQRLFDSQKGLTRFPGSVEDL